MFIVVEGGEGAARARRSALLAARLRDAGHAVDETREPGGTEAGVELRDKLLHGDAIDAETELEWMLEDRRLHVEQRIEPEPRAQMIVVVCDRFSPSTLAYQGVARGLGVDEVERRCAVATGGLEPDRGDRARPARRRRRGRVAADRDRFERAGADVPRPRSAPRTASSRRTRGWVVVDAERLARRGRRPGLGGRRTPSLGS